MIKNPKLYFLISLFLLLIVAGCGSGGSSTDGNASSGNGNSTEPIKLTIASFLPHNHQFTRDIIPLWIERIEAGTDGAVELDWNAGPESIPPNEQFDAVRNGIVDIGFNTSSFYGHLMPETLSLHMSTKLPWEERENGYFDYLSERFKEQNQIYLGRWLGPNPFLFWTNEKVETLSDFEGLKMRSNPTYHRILEALKASPVDVLPGEVYTSLERNMVDGFGFPLLGPAEDGWTEVTKYLIDEPFLNQNATIVINQKSFESLPADIQEKMNSITAEFEKEMYEHFNKENEKTLTLLEEQGIEIIKLKEEDSKKFQELVYEVYWNMLEQDNPDQIEKLKSLLQTE